MSGGVATEEVPAFTTVAELQASLIEVAEKDAPKEENSEDQPEESIEDENNDDSEDTTEVVNEDDDNHSSDNDSNSSSNDDTSNVEPPDNGSDPGLDADTERDQEPEPVPEKQLQSLGTFEATMYTAECPGCSGITRYGLDVRDTIYSPKGLRIIAVDPAVVAPMTVVRVEFSGGGSFKAVAADIGGAINGREIDILVGSRDEALNFGRQDVELTIE